MATGSEIFGKCVNYIYMKEPGRDSCMICKVVVLHTLWNTMYPLNFTRE
jgi:hypothetical protein